MSVKKQVIVLPTGKEISVDTVNINNKNYLGATDLFTQMGYDVSWQAPKIVVSDKTAMKETEPTNTKEVSPYQYITKNGCHIIKCDPQNFSIAEIKTNKKNSQVLSKYRNYFNLDYFGGNPMYSVCNLAIDGKILCQTKTLQGANTAGKAQTTLYTTKNGEARIDKISDLTTINNLDCAIGGVPFLINGEEVSLSKDIKTQGWSGGNFYKTWHTFITIQDGKIWLIAANTGHSNDVTATTVIANTLKSIGCTGTVIKLDGGGSFIFAKEGKVIQATSENRKINCIGVYA